MISEATFELPGKRYVVQELIGEGGMGTVYRALDRLTGEQIALKRVTIEPDQLRFASQSDSTNEDGLAREFQTLATLRHPNIIPVLDYGFDAGRKPYFTMRLLDKPRDLLEAGRDASREEKVRLLLGTLQALAYLHRRGVVHRDLKPANVLVDSSNHLHVLDFGLARARGERATGDQISGTLAYMAPETLVSDETHAAADLYAVGVMAYELFCAVHPYFTTDAAEMVNRILRVPPDLNRLHKMLAGVSDTAEIAPTETPTTVVIAWNAREFETPVEASEEADAAPAKNAHPLVAVIGRLLAKAPEERYPDADAVIRDLCYAANLPIPAESVEIRESFLQAANFVGRQMELDTLASALEALHAGKGGAWLIGGESGVGKSRLLDEVRIRALVQGALVMRGQAVSEGGTALHVWNEPLRRLALGAAPDDGEAAVLKTYLTDIADLLGRSVPDAPELEPRSAQTRLVAVVASLLRRLDQPAVLLLEDLHWAGSNSLALLSGLIAMHDLPVLLIGSYRDDEAPNLPEALPGAQTMTLRRLTDESIEALSVSMLGAAGSAPAVVDLLKRETEGNAFFLVEVVRALAENAGALSGVHLVTLPVKVFSGGMDQIVQRRLERVPAADTPLLELAAVAGRRIDTVLLEALANGISVEDWLSDCANAAVIALQDGVWQFAHDRLREGALTALDAETRRSLHRRVASAVEIVYPGDTSRAAGLAYHWEMAGDAAKEAYYAELAGERAYEASAYREALAYHEQALRALKQAAVPNIGSKEAKLYYNCGMAHEALSDYEDAIAAYSASLTAAEAAGDQGRVAHALRGWAQVQVMQSDFTIAGERLERSLALFRALHDVGGEARALGDLGTLAFYQGQVSRAYDLYQQALERSVEVRDRRRECAAYVNLGITSYVLGRADESRVHFRKALAIAKETGDRRSEANALGNLGNTYTDLREAITCYEQALALRRSIGDRRGQSNDITNIGSTYSKLGDVERAMTFYQESLRLSQEINEPYSTSSDLQSIGSAYLELGQVERALDYFQKALAIRLELGDKVSFAHNYSWLAAAHLAAGNLDTALDMARKSVPYADETESPDLMHGCRARLGDVLLAQGDFEAAAVAFADARTYEASEEQHSTAAHHGIALARLGRRENAQTAFEDGLKFADELLADTPQFYTASYARALALAGCALLEADDSARLALSVKAQAAHLAALDNCKAAGVVVQARRLLDLLMPLDREGLVKRINA